MKKIKESQPITIENIKKMKIKREKKFDWYNEAILRKISPYFDWLFLHIGLSGNQITFLSIVPVIIGSSLFLFSSPFYWILGWAVMQLYPILDCCDGEVARYKNQLTKFGYVMDEFLHPVSNAVVLAFATFGLFLIYRNLYIFIFGISAILFTLTNRILKLSFTIKKNITLAGKRFPFGGLTHLFLIPAILDVFFSDFRFLSLVLFGIIAPLIFLRNTVNIYKENKDATS
jgi:phosphatidylglycerophosphate synthase